jgi:competence protein ComEA
VSRAEIAAKAMVLTAIVALVVGGYSLLPHLRAERSTPVVLAPSSTLGSPEIVVHVSGAVTYPGLYHVNASTSLADLMEMAAAGPEGAPQSMSLIIDPAAGTPASQRVDLNHADAWLLDALPGIGPDRAQAIVDFREEHGLFSSTQELTMVPGLGDATYEALKDFVTVTA